MAEMLDVSFRGPVGNFTLDAAFSVPASGVTGLFGPSGCGKTTVLRAIAGLNRFHDGRCVVKGDVWQDGTRFLPAHQRPIGYVFQEPSLFSHLNVTDNLRFGLRGGGPGFDEVVSLLGLSHLLKRAPHHLSGGERQRVAIGRALLSNPQLMLMDEPLSALDAASRQDILPFLEALHHRMALPIVYVSHDMSEIERLADHLVLMEKGRVVASGLLQKVQSDPLLPWAKAHEASVSLDGVVTSVEPDGLATIAMSGGQLLVPCSAKQGDPQRVTLKAGDVSLSLSRVNDSTIINVLPAIIINAVAHDSHDRMAVLALGESGEGAQILARITERSWQRLGLTVGQAVFAQIKGVALAQKHRADRPKE